MRSVTAAKVRANTRYPVRLERRTRVGMKRRSQRQKAIGDKSVGRDAEGQNAKREIAGEAHGPMLAAHHAAEEGTNGRPAGPSAMERAGAWVVVAIAVAIIAAVAYFGLRRMEPALPPHAESVPEAAAPAAQPETTPQIRYPIRRSRTRRRWDGKGRLGCGMRSPASSPTSRSKPCSTGRISCSASSRPWTTCRGGRSRSG